MDNIFHTKPGETLNDLLVTIKHSSITDSDAIDVKVDLYVSIALPHDLVYKKHIESFLVTDKTPILPPEEKLNLVKISGCDTEFVAPPSGCKCYINCDVVLDQKSYNDETGNYGGMLPEYINAQDTMKMIGDIFFPDLIAEVSLSRDQMNMVILCELIKRYHYYINRQKPKETIFSKCKHLIDKFRSKKGCIK